MNRLILIVIVTLVAAYYVTSVLQLFKVIKMTHKPITMVKSLIPFYYWIF